MAFSWSTRTRNVSKLTYEDLNTIKTNISSVAGDIKCTSDYGNCTDYGYNSSDYWNDSDRRSNNSDDSDLSNLADLSHCQHDIDYRGHRGNIVPAY